MKNIIGSTLLVLTCNLLGNDKILPEYFGVYIKYKNGDLVSLKSVDKGSTILNFGGNIMDVMNSKRRSYVIQEPNITINMSEVDGFIVYGDDKITDNTAIYYMAKATKTEASFFDNSGLGSEQNSFLNIGYTCGKADGMKYKKIKDGMYFFDYPVDEKTQYKFCELTKNKSIPDDNILKSKNLQVDFYGLYYENKFWTFNVK